MNKNKTSFITLAIVGLFALISQSCAITDFRGKHSESDAPLNQDVQYTVKKGDLLGEISNAITGKISLWKEIAAYNEITDPRTLKVGDVITIPAALIPQTERGVTRAALDEQQLSSKNQSIAAASNSSTQSSIAATGALAVVQSSVKPDNTEEADVVIQPVSINRSFELNPIDNIDLDQSAQSGQAISSPLVRVIGSYYPKGVYEKPASYSTLIMRVAPGTVFELEREVNDWYKVITGDGVGYLRIIDGVIVDN